MAKVDLRSVEFYAEKIRSLPLKGGAAEEKQRLLGNLRLLATICEGESGFFSAPSEGPGLLSEGPPTFEAYLSEVIKLLTAQLTCVKSVVPDLDTTLAARRLFPALRQVKQLAARALLSEVTPSYFKAFALLTRAMVQTLTELSEKFPEVAQETAASATSWPLLVGKRKLQKHDRNFDLHQSLKIASKKPPLQDEIVRRIFNTRAAPGKTIIFELLWKLNVFRTTKGREIGLYLPAEMAATDLPPLNQKTAKAWYSCAWSLLEEVTDGHPESAPMLYRTFQGGGTNCRRGSKASNILAYMKKELRRLIGEAAKHFSMPDAPCAWEPLDALWQPFNRTTWMNEAAESPSLYVPPPKGHWSEGVFEPPAISERYSFLFSNDRTPNKTI